MVNKLRLETEVSDTLMLIGQNTTALVSKKACAELVSKAKPKIPTVCQFKCFLVFSFSEIYSFKL